MISSVTVFTVLCIMLYYSRVAGPGGAGGRFVFLVA